MGNLSGTQQALQDLYAVHIWMYSDELQPTLDKMLGIMIYELQLNVCTALYGLIW